MATIAELMAASGLESSQKYADTVTAGAQGAQMGAQLAQTIQNAQKQREQLEMQKQELQMNKAVAVTDTLKIAAQTKDPKLKNFLLKNVMPGKIKALGMEEFFGPQAIEMIQSSDEALQKVLGLQLDLEDKVNKGEITGAQAYQQARDILQNPEELALLNTDQLFEAQKFSVAESGKEGRARIVQQGQNARQQNQIDSAGHTELAKKIADVYSGYAAGGGRAAFDSSLGKLNETAVALESGSVKTGGVSTKIPGFKSDDAQSMLNPKMVEMKTQAQSALNAVLRQTLGAQFTEQEGLRVLNQVWDDRQSPAVNAKKIRLKISELKANMKNAESEFKRFGYMKGSDPGVTGWKETLKKQSAKVKSLPPAKQQEFLNKLVEKLNVPLEDLRKELGL